MSTQNREDWEGASPSTDPSRDRVSTPDDPDPQREMPDSIPGEREVPSLMRVRSMQSRVTTFLAVGLLSVIALGLLGWYYSKAFTRTSRDQTQAQGTAQQRAKGESPLPSLGAITQPRGAANSDPTALKRLMGPAPELPSEYRELTPQSPIHTAGRNDSAYGASVTQPAGPRPKSAAELDLERRLAGPVGSSTPGSSQGTPDATAYIKEPRSAESPRNLYQGLAGLLGGPQQPAPAVPADSLSARLQPTSTPAALAQLLPTQRLLLPKGAFIDCTLETALTSALPGMPTCVTATDTWSADGSVILLERGTKLIGESAGGAQRGTLRIFVLWTQARTPTGVVVPLASPGTDELGRSGLPGTVNRHFLERFGAAILISVIDGAIQAGTNRDQGGNTVILNHTGTQDIMTEVLRSTVNVAPTIDKHQGDRISILVARDLDFRGVYELRPVVAGR